jgi:hypothetical protein
VEHSVKIEKQPKLVRPDLSTFYSELRYADTSSVASQHARAEPNHVAAAHRLAAEYYTHISTDGETSSVVESIVEQLRNDFHQPPEKLEGVPDSFFDELERVDRKHLKDDDECPICNNVFLQGTGSFVVCFSDPQAANVTIQRNIYWLFACHAIQNTCLIWNAFNPG